MIRILSVATSVPPMKLSQKQALQFILTHFPNMRGGTRALYERILRNKSIQYRHFSMDAVEDILEENPDKINRRFETAAVRLSAESVRKALRSAGLRPRDVDFLVASTCTGYLCPGISTRMIDACGLRKDVHCLDVVGMGCGSAIPALEQAHNFIRAHPGSIAVSLSTEICSAAVFWGDSADLVVTNAIFADGSAAAVLGDSKKGGLAAIRSFETINFPEWREKLKFTTEKGRLRNVLSPEVPERSGEASRSVVRSLLKRNHLSQNKIDHWLIHAGGDKVIGAVQKALDLNDKHTASSRKVLREYGNLSSPMVLFTLAEEMRGRTPQNGRLGILSSFGTGFSAHACLVKFL